MFINVWDFTQPAEKLACLLGERSGLCVEAVGDKSLAQAIAQAVGSHPLDTAAQLLTALADSGVELDSKARTPTDDRNGLNEWRIHGKKGSTLVDLNVLSFGKALESPSWGRVAVEKGECSES